MEKEIKIVLKKTVKIAGVTCFALGGAALIASGAALKALTEGAKYLKNTVQEIIDDGAEADVVNNTIAAEEAFVEESVEAEESDVTAESCNLV